MPQKTVCPSRDGLNNGYTPQPGDVAVYGTPSSAAHVGVVISGSNQNPSVVNGDWEIDYPATFPTAGCVPDLREQRGRRALSGYEKPFACRAFVVSPTADGAEGDRTPDLVTASHALSQLSYGPGAAKSSGQFVVLSPTDARLLVVPCRPQPQVDLALIGEVLDRQEVTAILLRAVDGESINLVTRVCTLDVARAGSTTGAALDGHDVSTAWSPLALDANQSAVKVDDQVVTRPLVDGLVHVETELDCLVRDRGLSDGTFLVAREHCAIIVV